MHISFIFAVLIAGLFSWGLTAIGSAFIFVIKRLNQKIIDWLMGFAGGIMLSVSFWSLLLPAIKLSSQLKNYAWFPAALGFSLGVLFLRILDKILPHLHLGFSRNESEGIRSSWRTSILLILAIALHNIPEGLAIGVSFGAVAFGLSETNITSALTLVAGIGIQNIPEGFAIALFLWREGVSLFKSFWYGQLSAIVEPIAALLGVLMVLIMKNILPYALGFAAGAMIFVVVEEVIPESQRSKNADLASVGFMLGFLFMMVLDTVFNYSL